MQKGPLSGLRIIDLTRYVSGPYATMLLADAGATVIKVEPFGGDPARNAYPSFPGPKGGLAATFLRMNRGKLSVEIDLRSEKGREELSELLADADVLVENLKPGGLARLGFDETRLEEINPRLVYASISGFGHTPSPHRDRPAFNLIAEYEAGVYSRGGETPTPLGPYVGDLFPGLHALGGILMAIYERNRTGCGSRVDISMFDSMLSFNEAAGSYAAWLGDEEEGDTSQFYCPSGVYPCRDGYVCIDVVTDKQWATLCEVMERPDLVGEPALATGVRRSQRYDDLLAPVLLPWLERRTGEEVASVLSSRAVPSAVVRRPAAALTGEQAHARQMCIEVTSSSAEKGLPVAANPIRVGNHPRPTRARVPAAGEHTSTIFPDSQSKRRGADQY